jgi:hypothetical protein
MARTGTAAKKQKREKPDDNGNIPRQLMVPLLIRHGLHVMRSARNSRVPLIELA